MSGERPDVINPGTYFYLRARLDDQDAYIQELLCEIERLTERRA